MKLTDVISIWDNLPVNEDEYDCPEQESVNSLSFEDFLNAINKAVGVENDIEALRGG